MMIIAICRNFHKISGIILRPNPIDWLIDFCQFHVNSTWQNNYKKLYSVDACKITKCGKADMISVID